MTAVAAVLRGRRPTTVGRADGRLSAAIFLGAAALAALGYETESRPVFVAGVLGTAGLGAITVPELVLAAFLVAGAVKAAPWLAAAPADVTVLAAIGVLLAIAAVAVRGREVRLAVPTATVFAPMLAVLVLAGVLWSPDGALGLERALRFETLTMLAFAAPLVLIRTRAALIRLAAGLVGFGLVIALTATPTTSIASPLTVAGGNEIELGVYTAVGALCALGYLVTVGGPPGVRLLWLIPAGVLGAAVIGAGSRGALVSGALAVAFLWIRQLATDRRTRWVATIAIASAVAAASLIGPGALMGPTAEAKYRQGLISANEDSLVGTRNDVLYRGWELAVANPMGLGTGGYTATTGYVYPHNVFLELADDHGIIGLALFVALLIGAWRARRRAPGGPKSPEAILTGALLVFVVAEASVSLGLHDNRLLWFGLGLALAMPGLQRAP